MQSYPQAHNLPGVANQNGCLPKPTMRFSNITASFLSSLPERIDHGNVAAAGDIAMSVNASRTNLNMSANAVSANLSGTAHPQHATYLYALQQVGCQGDKAHCDKCSRVVGLSF